MNDSRARKAYESAVDDLKEFVAERTNLEVIISEETYPKERSLCRTTRSACLMRAMSTRTVRSAA